MSRFLRPLLRLLPLSVALMACEVPAIPTTTAPPGTGAAPASTATAHRTSASPGTAPAGPPAPPGTTVASVALAPGVERIDLGITAEALSKVAALDLDADGHEEVAVVSARGLEVRSPTAAGEWALRWRTEPLGGANVVATGDVDGDGRRDLVVGWGLHREHRGASVAVIAYRVGGPGDTLQPETIARPTTERPQLTSLQVTSLGKPAISGVLYAHFTSKYEVRAGFAARRGPAAWVDDTLDVVRMGSLWRAGTMRADARAPEIFVGRPYGEEPKSDGDVFSWKPARAAAAAGLPRREALPTVRGVRSLELVNLAPGDAPAFRAVCYGDGWHWMYGREADGLLTCAFPEPGGGWRAELVHDSDSWEVNSVATADLDGDGRPELVALTPAATWVHRRSPDGAWASRRLGPGGIHMTIADTNGDGRDEVVVAGESPFLLRLAPPTP